LLSRPNKRPRVRRDDEVSLYWSSDDDDVEMFLDNSAGPSSRCAKIASPLDATNLLQTGYNTTATITTISVIPNVENTFCCPNVISNFVAEDHMNRVDWILDSGASLHFTGDMNDFIEYTPLCHDFRRFSPLFLSKSQAPTHSTSLNHDMFPHSLSYLILSHVPFLLSYLSSSFGHFG